MTNNNTKRSKTPPREFFETLDDYQDLNNILTNGCKSPLLLELRGQAESPLKFRTGDMVIVDREKTAQNGDIVLKFSPEMWFFREHQSNNRRGLRLASSDGVVSAEPDNDYFGVVVHLITNFGGAND